jgi:hypothetical protein
VQGGTAGTSTGEYFPATNQWAVATAGTNAVLIDASQNVGIGTSTITYRLSVKQSGNTSLASIGISSINSANGTFIGMGYDSDSDTSRIFASYFTTGAYKPISLWTSDAERMRISSAGDVGIGTNSPGTLGKFEVQATDGNFTGLAIKNNATGSVLYGGSYTSIAMASQSASFSIVQVGGSGYLYGGPSSINFFQGSNAPMTFITNATERLRISAAGGVSIGNTTDAGVGNLSVTGTAGCSYFAADSTVTDTTLRTYTANTVYTLPANVTIIGGGADTFLVSIFIQYDNVGYHNWTGSAIISLTYWNAYGNGSQWSTQMSTHVNSNPVVTFYDTTGTGSRPIAFSISSTLAITTGGFVQVKFKRITTF